MDFFEEPLGDDDDDYQDDYLEEMLPDDISDQSLYFDSSPDHAQYNQMSIDEDYSLIESCVRPTLHDAILHFLLPILFANIFAKIVHHLIDRFARCLDSSPSTSRLRNLFLLRNLKNLTLIITGSSLLAYHFREDTIEFRLFAFLAFALSSVGIAALLRLHHLRFSNSDHSDPRRSPTLIIVTLWIAAFALISANEAAIYLHISNGTFVKFRPQVMLIVMKSISYFYESQDRTNFEKWNAAKNSKKNDDEDRKMRSHTSIEAFSFAAINIDFLAYLLHPNSSILGVWHPHHHQTEINRSSSAGGDDLHLSIFTFFGKIRRFPIVRATISFLLCIAFLLGSSCAIEHYINRLAYDRLFDLLESIAPLAAIRPIELVLIAYSTAVQFHFSHYFICFAAQSMFDLWNISLTITKPYAIEWPRSLVDVVIAWNVPMHQWLKRYVFQPFKGYCGGNIYGTILFTYLISSYLHGFNFQIWSVLLTLGILTSAEFKFRARLAHIFGACVESRACKYVLYQQQQQQSPRARSQEEMRQNRTQIEDEEVDNDNEDEFINSEEVEAKQEVLIWLCTTNRSHHFTGRERSWFSRAVSPVPWINGMFTALALVNLAFLGSTFDGKPDSSSIENVWFIWRSLYFYSHLIALVMFILYKLI